MRLFNDNFDTTLKHCRPRPVSLKFTRPKEKKQRTPWSLPISVFKDYVIDSDLLLLQCFEEDWKRIQKPKISEEKLEKCKEIFKKNYRVLRETYKYFSALGRTEGLFSINKIILSDFIAHKIGFLDGDKLTDMDLSFTEIKGRRKSAKFQPRTSLVRFEFLELLWRLAIRKLYNTKEVKSEEEALEKLIKDYIIPNCSQYNCQEFRDNRYWNEECDNIFKSHFAVFQNLYENNTGMKKLPGEKAFMCFEEFLGIFSTAKLLSEGFAEREIITAYSLSKMTNPDEYESDKHMKMGILEFFEGVARVAEGLSLPPLNSDPEDWPESKCKSQPLAEKIDNLLPYFIAITTKEFRSRYTRPGRDPETGLYLTPRIPLSRRSTIFASKIQTSASLF